MIDDESERVKKFLKRLVIITATIALTVGSVMLTKIHVTNTIIPEYTTAQNPVESFIFVNKQVVHIPRACIPLTKDDPCPIYDEDKDGMTDPDLIELPISSRSSGAIIGHNYELEESYVLTAYHICGNIRGPEFMSVLIESEHDDKEHPQWVAPHVLIVEVTGLFSIRDYRGNSYKAKVLRGDRKNDICVLNTELVHDVQPIKVASEPPPLNSKVYNIASPRGLSVPGAVLTFEGYITGPRPNGFHMFTFPVGPGSSGSPVLNEYGEIVSIVSHGYPWALSRIGWEANVGGGPQWKAIHDLIKPYHIQ